MTVFFDIDDTIYDRSSPFVFASEALFGHPIDQVQRAYRCCTNRGNEVFLAGQRGEITMDEMYIYRWGKGFADVGISITADEALQFEKLYTEFQGKIRMSATMEQVMDYAVQNFDHAGIITNGPSIKQRIKVNSLGLERWFRPEMILISGEVGYDKPDERLFRFAQERCGEAAADIIYVGDSMHHDIAPAHSMGWKTLWFNRFALTAPEHSPAPTAYAEKEEELLAVLAGLRSSML
ncbi:MAG: HAD family hydrolase [Oscillospiraceae bacterium]|nr:HAD family hydrolase [Oscillospiraceae bacterium]